MKLMNYVVLVLLTTFLSCKSIEEVSQDEKPKFEKIPNIIFDNNSVKTNIVNKTLEEGLIDLEKFPLNNVEEDAFIFYRNLWEDVGDSAILKYSKMEGQVGFNFFSGLSLKNNRLEKIFEEEDSVKLFHYHPSIGITKKYLIEIGKTDDLDLLIAESVAIPSAVDIINLSYRGQEHYNLHKGGEYEEGIVSEYGVTYLKLTEKGKKIPWKDLPEEEAFKISSSYASALAQFSIFYEPGEEVIRKSIRALNNDYLEVRFVPFGEEE